MALYNIHASKSFTKSLIDGINDRWGDDNILLSKIRVFLPSNRACKIFEQEYVKINDGKPKIIPKTLALGEIDEDVFIDNDFFVANYVEDLSVINNYEQKLIIVKILRNLIPNDRNYHYLFSIADLAIDLINELRRDDINIHQFKNDRYSKLFGEWSQISLILDLVFKEYPEYLELNSKIDYSAYRNNMLRKLNDYFQKNSYNYPIIIAGSTGSIKVTQELMKTIGSMENGFVILPGLDSNIDKNTWDNIDACHPQFNIKKFCDLVNRMPEKIDEWDGKITTHKPLLTEIFRPSSISEKWLKIKNDQSDNNINLIECENESEEARVISLIARNYLEENDKVISIVTSDINIAKRIKANLRIYDIVLEDSRGEQILQSERVKLFLLLLELIKTNFQPYEVLAFLKNKLINYADDKESHDFNVRIIEKDVIRKNMLKAGFTPLRNKIIEYTDKSWSQRFLDIIGPFYEISQKSMNFLDFFTSHIKTIENSISSDFNFYQDSDGEELYKILNQVSLYSSIFGEVNFEQYSQIVEYLFANHFYKITHNDSNIKILSPIEARHVDSDIVIIPGMNEGSWPQENSNRWLTNVIRDKLGLSLPNYHIALTAHDLYKLLYCQNVYLTRSNYTNGSPAVESRWISRLKILARYLSITEITKNDSKFLKWSKQFYLSKELKKNDKPAPKPPLKSRPNKFSLTEVELLIRNPYAIYVQKILNLVPLKSILKEPSHLEFGNYIHKIIDEYNKRYFSFKDNHYNQLYDLCLQILEEYQDSTMYIFWKSKINIIVIWLIEHDNELRKNYKLYTEVKGKYEFKNNNSLKTITAKADKICIDKDNNVIIIDYKTGTLPKTQDIYNILSPQLTLEGVIASKGFFDCMNPKFNYQVEKLAYIQVNGKNLNNEEKNLDLSKDLKNNSDEEISNRLIFSTELEIQKIISYYDNIDHAYEAYPEPKNAPKYDIYYHFARVKEWL